MLTQSGHLAVGFLSMVSAAMLAAVLADGRSMYVIEEPGAMPLTNTTGVGRYGFGTFYDSDGYSWGDSETFIRTHECDEHKRRFNLLKSGCIISILAAGTGIFFSLLGAARFRRVFGILSVVGNATLFVMSVIAMAVGWALWAGAFDCGGGSFRIKDNFDVSYGPFFLVACFVLAIVNLAILIASGALREQQPVENEPKSGSTAS
ncbi:hypothetical protein DIPPA_20088 [Diplonema papillatum]|nr:hypothetical protein DIPPA_20088 [Diplonema papillatum]